MIDKDEVNLKEFANKLLEPMWHRFGLMLTLVKRLRSRPLSPQRGVLAKIEGYMKINDRLR